MAALKHFYRERGADIWGPFGFYDAFNLAEDWYARSYIAIDQGPIIGMMENYRSGLLWDLFMANPEIGPALEAIGFVNDPYSITEPGSEPDITIYPTVFSDRFVVETLSGLRRIEVSSITGQIIFSTGNMGKGTHTIPATDWPKGLYLLTMEDPDGNHYNMKIIKY
jgi:hypothetical protein